jgi:hypothetical protein
MELRFAGEKTRSADASSRPLQLVVSVFVAFSGKHEGLADGESSIGQFPTVIE